MMRRLRRGDFHIDFIGRTRVWIGLMIVVLAVSVLSLGLRGINAGLEFRGGTSFEVEARSRGVTVSDMRTALASAGVDQATVQEVGSRGFLVGTPHLGPRTQEAAAGAIADVTGVERSDINVQDVGPKWGRQITNKAIQALIVFLVVAVIYISIRLEPKMAGAAMAAVLHDLVATAGIYSLSGFVVTPATVIAFLTVLGYSLYDTVVIFDRVKERTATLSAAGSVTYGAAANASLNQVLTRSISTSVTSLIPVGSLLFVGSLLLGAQTLRELALALFVGLTAGAYSSIFVATPILVLWKEREQRWGTLRARIAARGAAEAAVVGARTAPPAPAPRREVQAPPASPVRAPEAPAEPRYVTGGDTEERASAPASRTSIPSSRTRRRKKRKRRKR